MSKEVKIGNIKIGGNNPIAIQTMCDIKTSKIDEVIKEIEDVYEIGCDIIRVSCKDQEDCLAIKEIKKRIKIPLVADVHFDYRLCLQSIENGADKVRINPGNIGSDSKVELVAKAIKEHNICVRVGSNSGSIEKDYLNKYGRTYKALAESALKNVSIFEKFGVENIVISAKASDVQTTVEAYKYLSLKTDYPLHIGVTEAGTKDMGIVKSSIGIGALLLNRIGDTIRVSLTASIKEEVLTAKRILRSIGLDKNYVEIVSCPTCGRTSYNMKAIIDKVENFTKNIKKPLKVAIMGCVVNGPGEAMDCDIGLAGGDGKCVLFKHGTIYKTINEDQASDELIKEICALTEA